MKTYVTFGFDHRHNIGNTHFDHNCVAIVNGDRADVMRIFGTKFCFEYPEKRWDGTKMKKYYPDGYKEVIE